MLDSKGIPLYTAGASSPDTRKPAENAARAPVSQPVSTPQSQPARPNLRFEPPTQRFQSSTNAQGNAPTGTQQPAAQPQRAVANLVQNFLPGGVAQVLNGGMKRALSQAASFFQGNKRDTVDEKDRDKRRKNDFINLDLMGERKVEESNKSNLGGGQQ